MRLSSIFIVFIILGVTFSSCAPSSPSTLEVLESLEAATNDKNLEGTMALFSENAILDETYLPNYIPNEGLEEIETIWVSYFNAPWITDFRDISIEGDTATFIWADEGANYTLLWPVKVEIRKGKITYMDFYENATTVYQ